jgi:hypothetical protein
MSNQLNNQNLIVLRLEKEGAYFSKTLLYTHQTFNNLVKIK